MPSFEYNFTDTQLDLISLDEQRIYLFPQSDYDYIKLSVLSADGIFINSFNSNDSEVLTILSENVL